jgi:hypothetical protein
VDTVISIIAKLSKKWILLYPLLNGVLKKSLDKALQNCYVLALTAA